MSAYKTYIGGKDVKWWDGIARTFTRLISTGGNLTLNKIGAEVDVLEAYGDGDTYTDATLNKALSGIGTNACTIVLQPGTWTLSNDVTIPANVSLRMPKGAICAVATGKTLTINGPFQSAHYQVFSGAGTVVFGVQAVRDILPEWWGAVADGATDCGPAIGKAIVAANTMGGCNIRLGSGTYSIQTTVTGKSHVNFIGTASMPYWGTGAILELDANVTMFDFDAGSAGWGFSNIRFIGNERDYPIFDLSAETGGADNKGNFDVHFTECTWYKCNPAFHAINCWDFWFNNCGFVECGDYAAGPADINKCAIYVVNTRIGGGQGAFCNNWHFTSCTASPTYGRFLWSEYDAVDVNPNAGFFFVNCSIEGSFGGTDGYEAIYGTIANLQIVNSYFGGVGGGRPLIRLIGVNGKSGGSFFVGNLFKSGTGYTVQTSSWSDIYIGNNFLGEPTTAFVQLVDEGTYTAYKNTFFGNKTYNTAPEKPLIDDDTTTNQSWFLNDGSDSAVIGSTDNAATHKIPIEYQGYTLYILATTSSATS